MSAASVSLALSRCGKNAGSGSALIGFFSMVLGGVMMPVVGVAGDHTAVHGSHHGIGLCVFRPLLLQDDCSQASERVAGVEREAWRMPAPC